MKEQVIISGFGGQGVLSAGFLLAEAAVHADLQVTYYPSYGAEMRGGTANCHVILSDREIYSPLITLADTLIALTQQAFDKFAAMVRQGGIILADQSVRSKNVLGKVVALPFDEVTLKEVGNIRVLNTVVLGAYAALCKSWMKLEWLEEAIEHKFFNKGAKIVDLNKKALHKGYDLLA